MTRPPISPAFLLLFCLTATAASAEFSAWSEPSNLGATINSAAADGCPAISRDGLTLFFASTRPGGAGSFDIYVSERPRTDAPWGPPVNVGTHVNSAAGEICPALAYSRRSLYFVSNRPGGCGGQDLYVARRDDRSDAAGWKAAVNLGCTVNSASDDFGPAYYEDPDTGTATLYFSSDRPMGSGGIDLYAAGEQPDGTFGTPVLLEELNTAFHDARPTVRRDGLEMIFDSNRPGALGAHDLWVSTRESTSDAWGTPVWMDVVNSSGIEVRPALSFDGTTLYFTSNRPGGFGLVDVWQSVRTRLAPVPTGAYVPAFDCANRRP